MSHTITDRSKRYTLIETRGVSVQDRSGRGLEVWDGFQSPPIPSQPSILLQTNAFILLQTGGKILRSSP